MNISKSLLVIFLVTSSIVAKAQYQIFLKDQFLFTAEAVTQDSLGVHFKLNDIDKFYPYKDVYAIRSDEESFYFRGRYARRSRRYQPSFYDLSRDFSFGINALPFTYKQMEMEVTYFPEAQKVLELAFKARFTLGDMRLNDANRRFQDMYSLEVRKYVTLKRQVRFSYGLGAGYGRADYDLDNINDQHPSYYASLENYYKEHPNNNWYNSEDNYRKRKEVALENLKEDEHLAIYLTTNTRIMLDKSMSLNLGFDIGWIGGRYFESLNEKNGKTYTDFYFVPKISLNYHFNAKLNQ